jgi:hypothetical protein
MKIYGGELIPSGSITTIPITAFAITGSNTFIGNQTFSGSLIPSVNGVYDLGDDTHQFRHLYLSSASLYIDGTKVLGSTAQELQITTDTGQSFKILEAGSDTITLQSNDGNITLATSGGGDVILDPTNGIIALKGTTTVYSGFKIVSSDGNNIHLGNGLTVTGSIVSTETSLVSGSSQITYSGLTGIPLGIISGSSQLPSGLISGSSQLPSGLISGSSQLPSGLISGSSQLPSGILSGSSQLSGFGLATTGSNNFIGTQTITGSLFISSDLVVQGSSSLQNITASAVNIGANVVNLNTANPAIRFAGINIFDSGSIGGSGSFLYDSVQDEFIFVHRGNGTNVTSSHFILGPETYDNLGNETYLTNNRIPKGTGIEHLNDSNITDTGTLITLGSNTVINGTLSATGTTLVSGSSQITYGGISSIPSGIVSGSSQITYSGISSIPSGIVSGSSQIIYANISSIPAGIVSGSSQIDVMSTTNIARLATTGSNSFNGNTTITGSLTIGPSTSTFPVNVYTSSANTFGTIAEFYNGDFTAGARTFIRVRNQISAGSTMSSYFGQGQDGKTYIIANNSARGGDIVIDGNSGNTTFAANALPAANGTQDLGSAALRWGTVYTSDLSLNNGIGDWTIVEGEDDLFLYNNKKGKVYKFALTEVDPNIATPKKS